MGAIIESIMQNGLERVVRLSLSSRDELMRPVSLDLIVEIMGKYSNVILADSGGRIIDSLKRISLDQSSKRQVLPGMAYSDPPQRKFDPLNISGTTLLEALSTKKDTRLIQHMTSVFEGISSQTAAEILHRAGIGATFTSELSAKQFERIATTTQEFLRQASSDPHPCIQLNGDGLPVFFSCVPFETFPESHRRRFEECNEMLDFYYTRRAEIFRMTQQKEALAKNISRLLGKVEKKITIYRNNISDASRAGKVKARADAITTNIYRLKKGIAEFEATDYETGKQVKVALDLSMTPQQLAQKLYKKVAKQKKSMEMNTAWLKDALDEQEFLLGTLHYTENARDSSDIGEIKSSLANAGYLPKPPKNKAKEQAESLPLRFVSPSGYDIFVGKNDRQNDILTMRTAAKDDIWFHAQKIPGSHVILSTNGAALDDIDDGTIVYAASLAAHYSRAKQSGKTPVDYTQRKNIKKPPGSRPGKVIYDDYFTVYVDAGGIAEKQAD
jgi:predicted ribosome quality control (RQC) complex YloA/Tae2 family protein